MDRLPLEAQFAHASFMTQAQQMSSEQRLEMLDKLYVSYLGHRKFIKTQARAELGIEIAPVRGLD